MTRSVSRVNKTFRDTINGSTKIREQLFFRPDPNNHGGPRVNPFPPRILNLLAVDAKLSYVHQSSEFDRPDEEPGVQLWSTGWPDFVCIYLRYFRDSFAQYRHSSWINMLAVDPPRDVRVRYYYKEGEWKSIDMRVKAANVQDVVEMLETAFTRGNRRASLRSL